ncbi:MAG: DNA polymerase III subunit epsilon [Hydrogenophilales bacterium CG03_land_8_20_14_0_80_62_28]|nr:3'-5' exonuclease [Betaproteobacteria bacterium]OIO79724.1 MAG: DNA polymerase III subunit epsilon [Hydrogenophilaceae bacterium CG1_02_62_390]PIV23489.1 MAG: DNA polymerase III subunit epsilon [Hydrogenophilales bacterium CG03_land_8_20_14_0_80_62_28]PIW38807.1 MAG: DNA polymerase III subunit epsilon [Hydrogenophilales bacterium CG15_BIG_FIL_POST_REV_8_21_14_020_62_31]PIW71692.1 MAG: DNA polymerase III subunit epsilon [Hydrogenophilales bacterium CG12_big_fil_rev_8_21_14_0_65_61_21]PIX0070
MNWLSRLLGNEKPPLTPEQARRLAAWRALPTPAPRRPHDQARYVVVDVESSGLNVNRDRLIAIGAIAVNHGRIDLADGLEIVLKQETISAKDNILIHGITDDVQRGGVPPAEALLVFLEYVGKDPLIAFHVAFDNTMISKALRKVLGFKLDHGWADLAYIAPALYPELRYQCRSLDQWMKHFGIGNFARHSALADALATAELLLALRPRLAAKKIADFHGLRDTYLTQYRATTPHSGM